MPTKKTTSTTTRSSAKKKAAPKRSTKAVATRSAKSAPKKKSLITAPEQECFWTLDGQILQDLNQLQVALGQMHEQVFAHHVNKEKNDFATWVELTLKDKECADALRKSRKPSSARTVVVRHLRTYLL